MLPKQKQPNKNFALMKDDDLQEEISEQRLKRESDQSQLSITDHF